jgi:hypothetical protein
MQPTTRRRLVPTGLAVGAVVLASALVAAPMGGEPRGGPQGDPRGGGPPTGSAADPLEPGAPSVLDLPGSPGPGSPTPAADPVLLPNLRSLPAEAVLVRTEDGNRILRFAGILANVGVGPLELTPRRSAACPAGQHPADQRLYRDGDGDGRYVVRTDRKRVTRPAGCMLVHPGHDHWHFDAMAGYALLRPDGGDPIVSRDKVSFCLRDNRRVAGMPASTPRRYGDCEDRLDRQGISAGWADVYSNDLDGQVLDIPDNLPNGAYCLHTVADPHGLIQESDESDNAAVLAIQITGAQVRPASARSCD